MDPIGIVGGNNTHQYAISSPIGLEDSNGKMPRKRTAMDPKPGSDDEQGGSTEVSSIARDENASLYQDKKIPATLDAPELDPAVPPSQYGRDALREVVRWSAEIQQRQPGNARSGWRERESGRTAHYGFEAVENSDIAFATAGSRTSRTSPASSAGSVIGAALGNSTSTEWSRVRLVARMYALLTLRAHTHPFLGGGRWAASIFSLPDARKFAAKSGESLGATIDIVLRGRSDAFSRRGRVSGTIYTRDAITPDSKADSSDMKHVTDLLEIKPGKTYKPPSHSALLRAFLTDLPETNVRIYTFKYNLRKNIVRIREVPP